MSDTEPSRAISAGTDELTAIAGSVVLSESPAHQLKYWRKTFGIKQADLARKMNITPSVLSDYEKGRRPSPGVNFIKRYLLALHELTQSGEYSGQGHRRPEGEQAKAAPVADAHINQS